MVLLRAATDVVAQAIAVEAGGFLRRPFTLAALIDVVGRFFPHDDVPSAGQRVASRPAPAAWVTSAVGVTTAPAATRSATRDGTEHRLGG